MRTTGFLTSLLAVLFFVGSCRTAMKVGPGKTGSENGELSDLTHVEAQSRKSRLSKIEYKLSVSLGENERNFRGTNLISFQLKDTLQPLRIDFHEGQIETIQVNGQVMRPSVKKRFHIEIPPSALKAGANEVEIRYLADYSREGAGLHRFADPKTGDVFVYTQFEPYDANRFFPCFDQPDLRAILRMQVEVPATWSVIANAQETQVIASGEGRKLWIFSPTSELATYLFALHAGPFKVWTDHHGRIPLRIFARPSMAEYVRPEEWFRWTKQGLDFFTAYFGYAYPFAKYDYVFVPQFNWGAMENVAAVTVNESFLHRSAPSRIQRRNTVNVIFHEMAHMWFGNLVTMSWWNDLWLNESFATYMAYLALAEATEFKEAWQSFFWGDKDGAYWEDSLVTTHPIETTISNVKSAFANFDGITYGKGASALKQLRKYIGEKPFDQGIRLYIKTHAHKNTELKDFISSLQKYTKKNLRQWAALWLQQSGTDTLSASWKCKGGQLAEVRLLARSPENTKFRPQIVELGLFGSHRGRFTLPTSVLVELKNPVTTVKGAWSCPTFVYPNARDHGYISVQLDPTSLGYLRGNLSSLQDPLLRAMIWNDLWEMVRTGHMPLRQYVEILDLHFAKENDLLNQTAVASNLDSVLRYWPQVSEGEKRARESFIKIYENLFLQRLLSAQAGSEEQKFWFDQFVNLAQSDKNLELLRTWLEGKSTIPGLNLDADRRWSLIRQLARFTGKDADHYLSAMKAEDVSERGQRQALVSEAIQPVLAIKTKWIQQFQGSKSQLSLAEAHSVMESLFPYEQMALAKKFAPAFYKYLSQHGADEDKLALTTAIARSISPLFCEAEYSKAYRSFLDRAQFAPPVSRALRVNLQEDERCQMIRERSGF